MQRSTWVLGTFLRDEGFTVGIASLAQGEDPGPQGIQVFGAPSPGGIEAAANQEALTQWIRSFRPSLVVNQMGFNPTLSQLVWRLRSEVGYRVIACYRNNPSWYRANLRHVLREHTRGKGAKRWLVNNPLGYAAAWVHHTVQNRKVFRESVERSDRYMLLSPTFTDELRWYVPTLKQGKVVILPNQFDVPDEPPSDKRNILLYVGRLEQAQKQVMLLAPLWQGLSGHLPDWELHIAGDGPDRARLEEEMLRRGLPRVTFHGKTDPHPLYRKAKIFTMLSRYEGFGNTLIEAQAQGAVPVAFNSYSAIQWMLNDSAVLVKPFDLSAYQERVLALARDARLLEQMSSAAHRNAQRFSNARSGGRWIGVIEELLAERPIAEAV